MHDNQYIVDTETNSITPNKYAAPRTYLRCKRCGHTEEVSQGGFFKQ